MKKALLIVMVLVVVFVGFTELFPEQVADFAINSERARGGLDYKTISVGGETWHYLEGGPPDAEIVVVVHGFGGSKDSWTRFARFVTDHYRMVIPDLPGFGQSARHPDWDYSLPLQRDRLHEFLQALGVDSFHIVGVSMGGHVSGLYAHKYPEHVRSLALFDNAGVMPPVESDMWRSVTSGDNPLIVESVEDFDRLLGFVFHEEPFIPWPIRRAYAKRAATQGAFNRTIFTAIRADTESGLEPLLPDIEQPALILWGELDRVIDKSAIEVMRPLLQRSEVVVLKDTGHVPMLERPAESAAHYLEFVGKY